MRMTRPILLVMTLLIPVSAIPAAWPEKGVRAYAHIDLMRAATDSDISLRRQAGVGIPIDRLEAHNTAFWWYRSPACLPLEITKVHEDSISIADGLFRFRLEGDWQLVLHETEKECQEARRADDPVRHELVNTSGVIRVSAAPAAAPTTE
jgi:hypothetical protein